MILMKQYFSGSWSASPSARDEPARYLSRDKLMPQRRRMIPVAQQILKISVPVNIAFIRRKTVA